MGEGETPLVRSQRLEASLGCGPLYFKLESCNPTGSFKDRGHGGGGGQGAGGGPQGGPLRLHRQHQRRRRRLRCPLRPQGLRPRAEGEHRPGEAGPGGGPRRRGHRHRRQLRPGPAPWRAPSPTGIPSPWSTPSTPIASRGRRRPPSRSSTPWAMRPTICSSRWATPATSPPTGGASWSTTQRGEASKRPRMMGFQAEGAAPIVLGRPVAEPRDRRLGHPHRQPG